MSIKIGGLQKDRTILSKKVDMDAVLRFSLFLCLSSIGFLLLVPAMINSINFWMRVFDISKESINIPL